MTALQAGTPSADAPLRRHFPQWETYRSPAQLWATRILAGAPPGGCILTVVTTGGGKTLTFAIPMLEERRRHGRASTLLVVPTISLMADMAEGLRTRYHPASGQIRALESHSGLTPELRHERETSFFTGELEVLIVSPERALQHNFVQRLAGMGKALRFLVIDEAHLLADWGEGFRHDFQRLGWLRSYLLETNPWLRTALLSATVTAATERTIREVMEVPDELWRTVRGSSLRFEAQLAVEPLNAGDRAASEQWLRDHVANLEEPALIYVTRPKHAEELAQLLRGMGKKAAAYHGKTHNNERERVLRAWHSGEVRFVVGTSAFGLGIDKADVRTVVHLCIPESLDRLYQEVGRAGRDGDPCQATVVSVAEDARVARRNALRLMRELIARPRWEQMVGTGQLMEQDENGCIWLVNEETIPLNWTPQWWSPEDLKRVDLHTDWNKSLVNFFQRCGFLRYEGSLVSELRGKPSPATRSLLAEFGVLAPPTDGVVTIHWRELAAAPWAEQRARMNRLADSLFEPERELRSVLRVSDLRCLDHDGPKAATFWQDVNERRKTELAESYAAIDVAVRYARDPHEECLRRPFAELYGEYLNSCGACMWCQSHHAQRSPVRRFTPPKPWAPSMEQALAPPLESIFEGRDRACVVAAPSRELMAQLEAAGIGQFVAPRAWGGGATDVVFHPVEDFDASYTLIEALPTAILLPPKTDENVARRAYQQLWLKPEATFGSPGRLLLVLDEHISWPGIGDALDRMETVHNGGPRLRVALVRVVLAKEQA